MRKESGKTLREIRRAKKLRKKLMTDEERLIYNLKRVRIWNFSLRRTIELLAYKFGQMMMVSFIRVRLCVS